MDIKTVTVDVDILVVGHGLAGLAAVHAVKDENPDLRVLAVDKGSLGYAGKANKGGGHVSFIPEGAEESYVEYHTRNLGDYLNNQDALRKYARSTIKTMDKWEAWGAKFVGRDIAFNAHPSIPWKVCMIDADVLIKMAEKAKSKGVEFQDKVDIVELLMDNGRVSGAIGFSMLTGECLVYKARAVILANGNQNWGIMKMWASGTGEGIAAAYRAGAEMRNPEFGSFVNIVSLDHGHVSYEAENFMYNSEGEKVDPGIVQLEGAAFTNACGGNDIGGAIGMVMYSHVLNGKGPIFENHAENDFPHNPFGQIIFPMHGRAPDEWYRPVTHKFAHRLYDKNKEGAYAKNSETDLKEVEPGVVGECSPLYADENMASNVPGLYSCGDINANGTSWAGAVPTPPGRNRGFGLLHAVYTASIAGPAAVNYVSQAGQLNTNTEEINALKERIYEPLHRMEGTTTDEVQTRIRNLMQYVPYTNFKSETRIKEALREVNKLKEEVKKLVAADFHGLAKAHACSAMVLCAEMFFRCSLERKESRGWHIREDYPQRDDENMLRWFSAYKGPDDEMIIKSIPIPMETYQYKP